MHNYNETQNKKVKKNENPKKFCKMKNIVQYNPVLPYLF
jgi:hypothetical protein